MNRLVLETNLAQVDSALVRNGLGEEDSPSQYGYDSSYSDSPGLVSAGVCISMLLTSIGIHGLASRDVNLSHTPVWLFSAAGVLLIIVMLAASLVPARHVASVDPMLA